MAGSLLLGVNLAGAEFGSNVPGVFGTDYTYPTHAEIDYYAAKGMGVIRLPFLWERVQRSEFAALDATELSRLDDVVNYTTGKGLKIEIEPHNYGYGFGALIGTAQTPNSAFADLWGKLAGHFQSNSGVIFGLMNEPHDQSASAWLGSANAAIAAIRGAGAVSQEILVPGSYWDGAWTWVSSDNDTVIGAGVQDPAHNFAFEVHQYLDADGSGTHPGVVSATIGVERLTAITQWAEATGNRLFLGEVGVTTDQTSLTAFDGMLTYMQQHTGVWQGVTYWAGGPWWGNYMFSIESQNGVDKPQMGILVQHLSAPSGDYNGTPGPDTFSANGNLLHAYGNDGNDQLSVIGNQNQLSGGNGDDALSANGTNNSLYGDAGNDMLTVSGGANQLYGGTGNDAYTVDHTGDGIIENASEGIDTVYATAHFRLSANVENLVLQGGADLQAYGNGDSNAIYGNAGSNVLDGGLGADGMLGGAGNDAYFVDNAGDAVFENSGEGPNVRQRDWAVREHGLHMAGDNVADGKVVAAITDLPHRNAGLELEQLDGEARQCPAAVMREVDRVGLRVRQLDQLAHALDRHLRIDHEHERILRDVDDVGEIAFRLEREVGQRRRHHGKAGRCPHQGVAIRCCAGDLLERDGAAGSRLILDQEALPEIVVHVARENPRQDIGAAAGRKRHHQLDDPVGVWLRGDADRSACQRRQNNEERYGFHGSRPQGYDVRPQTHASLEVLDLPFALGIQPTLQSDGTLPHLGTFPAQLCGIALATVRWHCRVWIRPIFNTHQANVRGCSQQERRDLQFWTNAQAGNESL
jgi:endoglucanase